MDKKTYTDSKWEKSADTLMCNKCGFGYFPSDYYFEKRICTGSKDTIFNFCPNCGADMRESEVKE